MAYPLNLWPCKHWWLETLTLGLFYYKKPPLPTIPRLAPMHGTPGLACTAARIRRIYFAQFIRRYTRRRFFWCRCEEARFKLVCNLFSHSGHLAEWWSQIPNDTPVGAVIWFLLNAKLDPAEC